MIMNETTDSHPNRWLVRWQRLRNGARRFFPFALGILAAFGALLLYQAVFPGKPPLTTQDVNASIASAMASATPPLAFSARAFQVIQPSLVLIQTHVSDQNGDEEDSLGSGVVVTDQGAILTSLHVVADANVIVVTFADGTQSHAQIVDKQPDHDIAVLQADQPPEKVVPAVLGNPGAMHVGDETYAVGNPFGLYGSMSSGVISGFNRTFHMPNSDQVLEGLIQVDAAVNPGNSGGPLLNRYGQVIGIVTGIVNPTEDNFFVGVGFAVPINTAVGGMGGSPPY
jgi:S1-C subfamily serine protease